MSQRKIGEWSRDWARKNDVPVIYTDATESTNTDARLFDKSFNRLSLIVTDLQTKGRGRGDHTWETPEVGHYLLSSWVADLANAPHPIFSARMGLLIFQSAKSTWPKLCFSLKAPNDLFLDEQKVAGLLIEIISQANRHRLVVGLGLNISAAPRMPTATNIETKLGRSITAEEWSDFLSTWSKGLRTHCTDAERNVLNYQECEDLRQALNLFPPLKDQVLMVQPTASLQLKTRNVNWHEL